MNFSLSVKWIVVVLTAFTTVCNEKSLAGVSAYSGQSTFLSPGLPLVANLAVPQRKWNEILKADAGQKTKELRQTADDVGEKTEELGETIRNEVSSSTSKIQEKSSEVGTAINKKFEDKEEGWGRKLENTWRNTKSSVSHWTGWVGQKIKGAAQTTIETASSILTRVKKFFTGIFRNKQDGSTKTRRNSDTF